MRCKKKEFLYVKVPDMHDYYHAVKDTYLGRNCSRRLDSYRWVPFSWRKNCYCIQKFIYCCQQMVAVASLVCHIMEYFICHERSHGTTHFMEVCQSTLQTACCESHSELLILRSTAEEKSDGVCHICITSTT